MIKVQDSDGHLIATMFDTADNALLLAETFEGEFNENTFTITNKVQ